jgi:hypothetical protein
LSVIFWVVLVVVLVAVGYLGFAGASNGGG